MSSNGTRRPEATAPTAIGFIGIGGMGSRMARRVLDAGFSLVVHDTRREATRSLEESGAKHAPSPAAVAESCDLVLSMLPTAPSVIEVAIGPGGLIEASGEGRVWIDFSSIDKNSVLELHRSLGAGGWRIMDASVNGVEEEAAAGTLRTWVCPSRS